MFHFSVGSNQVQREALLELRTDIVAVVDEGTQLHVGEKLGAGFRGRFGGTLRHYFTILGLELRLPIDAFEDRQQLLKPHSSATVD